MNIMEKKESQILKQQNDMKDTIRVKRSCLKLIMKIKEDLKKGYKV